MDNFLKSYTIELKEQRPSEDRKKELKTVLSAVTVLLRRHSIDNRLCSKCCNDNENDLRVTGIDSYGFVTEVECTHCQNYMNTVCSTKWTKERIYDPLELKEGDHICWHRWYVISHHAIVSSTDPLKVIHYHSALKVEENTFDDVTTCSESCTGCDALYRIVYEDCYNADYTTLRAEKLLNESEYNMVERNCEHFSSWCKTGASTSGQVNILFASCLKAFIMTICLVVMAVLHLIPYFQEEFKKEVNNHKVFEIEEKGLNTWFCILGVTMLFAIYKLIASGEQLAVDSSNRRCRDSKNPWSFTEFLYKCTGTSNTYWLWRCICCSASSCLGLFRRGFLYFSKWCRHIKCCPFTCCRRPGELTCGLFFRNILEEIPGLIGTLCIIVYGDTVFKGFSSVAETFVIMLCIVVVQLVGYVPGAFLGRLVEALFECSCWDRTLPSSRQAVP